MFDASKSWPALSLAEAHARLTAAGSPFETETVTVRGQALTVWKRCPATMRDVVERMLGFGSREFLIYDGERITFDAFTRAVLVLAAHLKNLGLEPGDRIAIAMRNMPEWPLVFFAATLIGAIAVPLNAWGTAAELAHGLADSGSLFLFADEERLARLAALPPHAFSVRAASCGDATALESIIGLPMAWAGLPRHALPDFVPAPEDDAAIFYTSGTTSTPKGALLTHRNLTTNIFAAPFSLARNALRGGEASVPPPRGLAQRVTLVAVPFFHVTAALAALVPHAATGGKLVLMRKFEPEAAMVLIERERVRLLGGVPSITLAVLDHPRRGDYDLSSLDIVSYGGAPVPAALASRVAQAFAGAVPGQGWGMTETSATHTSHSGADYLARPASCGPALPVCRIKVMQDDREAPLGEVGELWAFGPNIAKGYWNKADETAAAFQDGWVRTGDLARVDAEGFCFVVDRIKDMVIRGGENIYAAEVESTLCDHPAVSEAALIGLSHPVLGEEPGAVVHPRAGQSLDGESLRTFAAARLAGFKVPVKIVVSSQPLPRNANGKVVKAALQALFVS